MIFHFHSLSIFFGYFYSVCVSVLLIWNGLVVSFCFVAISFTCGAVSLFLFFHLTIPYIQSFGSFLNAIVLIDNIRIFKSFVKFRFCFYPIRLTNTAMFVKHRYDTIRYDTDRSMKWFNF